MASKLFSFIRESKALLSFICFSIAGAALVCLPVYAAGMGPDDARHLLTRTGFAPNPNEIATFSLLTREEAVDRILAGTHNIPVTPYPDDLNDHFPPKRFRIMNEEQRRELNRVQLRVKGVEIRAWWLNEMLHTTSPLTERMTLFWHNHFVSSQEKVKSAKLMLDQNLLLREYAVGNFRKLLHAVSKDPAMVIYLDVATNRKGQANENFAREVMELFTLGEGHYSEQDIKEAARAFTGWSIDADSGLFAHRRNVHDEGIKIVFGKSGNFDGDDILDLLLARKETSEFIVGKLWREFVSPQVEVETVRHVARTFRERDYEIKPVLREIFLSRSFWAPESRGAIVKSPVDLVVGSLRSLDAEVADATPFVRTLRQLGQDIFAPPNVRGWLGGEIWINTSALLGRKQFLDRIVRADESGRTAATSNMNTGNAMASRAMTTARDMDINMQAWEQSVLSGGLTREMVLLAVAPVEKNEKATGNDRLRALLLDPSFQVK